MQPKQRNSRRPIRLLLLTLIIASGVLIRIAAAFLLGNEVDSLPGIADQVSYHNLALRVMAGEGFSFGEDWWPATKAGEPTAHWSYLYTFFLALVYSLFGSSPLAARLIQVMIVGVLQPYLAYRIGSRVFGAPAGIAAAALTAFYAYFIYYSAALMTEPFYITAVLLSLYLAILMAERPKVESQESQNSRSLYRLVLPFALSLGAAVLLRQLFLLVIPFIVLWIWWAGGRKRVAPVILAGLLVLGMVLPFTVYNYLRFDRFVLLNTNAGFAFFWGNHPVYGTHFEEILPPELGTYMDLIPKELFRLDEAALDQELLKRGVGFVLDDPARYVLLSLSRIPAFFAFLPSEDSDLISNISRVASFGLAWPFMLYGLLRALLPAFRSPGQTLRSPAALLALFGLVYTGVHILTWALIRYRLPVDAVMLVFAGGALVELGRLILPQNKQNREARELR